MTTLTETKRERTIAVFRMWALLCPGECGITDYGEPSKEVFDVRVSFNGKIAGNSGNSFGYERHGQAILQRYIQEQIKARGWFGMIDTNGLASVSPVNYITQAECKVFYGQNEDEAIALLTAYLQAVEASV